MGLDLPARYSHFVEAALEASIYVAPTAHGLTQSELHEVGVATGHKRGAIDDAVTRLRNSGRVVTDGQRIVFVPSDAHQFANFIRGCFEDDPRDPQALDFPMRHLRDLEEEHGKSAAQDTIDNVVSAGERAGISREKMQIATGVLILARWLDESAGQIRISRSKSSDSRPSELMSAQNAITRDGIWKRPGFSDVRVAVKDVILRRATEPQRALAATGTGALLPPAQDLAHRFDGCEFHPFVLKHCRALFVGGHFRQAVLAGCLQTLAEIRIRTNRTEDGDDLVNLVFNAKSPLLQVTAMRTDSEKSVQNGVMFLAKAMVALFRNPLAHTAPDPPITEALEALALLSMIARHIDAAAT